MGRGIFTQNMLWVDPHFFFGGSSPSASRKGRAILSTSPAPHPQLGREGEGAESTDRLAIIQDCVCVCV